MKTRSTNNWNGQPSESYLAPEDAWTPREQEKQAVALEAAKNVCGMGYGPDEAASIVTVMDDHTFAELCEWYTQFTNSHG